MHRLDISGCSGLAALHLLLALGIASSAFGAPAPAAGRLAAFSGKAVMVPPFKILGVSTEEAAHVAAVAAEALAKSSTFQVVTAAEIDTLVATEKDRMKLGCQDESCFAELARAAKAPLVLSGSLGKVGQDLLLSLSLLDVESSESLGSASRSAPTVEKLVELIPEAIAETLGTDLAASKKPVYRLPGDRVVSMAVFDVKPLGISETSAQNLTQILASEVKKIQGTKVISRADIASLLEMNTEKARTGCFDDSCLAEIGGALGVEKLIVGHAGTLGAQYVVSLRLIDVQQVSVDSRVTEVFSGVEDQLLPAVRQCGRRLLGFEDSEPGNLAVAGSETEAEVTLDNAKVGVLPLPALTGLTPGRHSLQLTKDGFITWRSDVYVDPGGTTPLWVTLQEAPLEWYQEWWVWTAAGTVLVGATVATILLLQPKSGMLIVQGAAPGGAR